MNMNILHELKEIDNSILMIGGEKEKENTDYDRELQILQSGDRRRLYSPDKTFSSPRIPGRSVKRN